MRVVSLLLEDDPDICALVQYLLERAGLEVITVENTEAVFASLSQHQPDVLLVSLPWPPDTRLALIQQVRMTATAAALPILVLMQDDRYRTEVQQAGATAIIRKPEDLPHLAEAIRTVLPHSLQSV